jgi:hypothetical protein
MADLIVVNEKAKAKSEKQRPWQQLKRNGMVSQARASVRQRA